MAHNFWTQPQRDPMRKYRFLVNIPSLPQGGQWYVKKVKKPSAEVSETAHNYLNHTFKYPGRVTWADCEMTFVDPVDPGAGHELAAILQASGYVVPQNYTTVTTISKHRAIEMLGNKIEIYQIDDHITPNGDIVPLGLGVAAGGGGGGFSSLEISEKWVLRNPWIKNVDWGEGDFESDDLNEVTVTFAYDWAEYKRPDGRVPALTDTVPTAGTLSKKQLFEPL